MKCEGIYKVERLHLRLFMPTSNIKGEVLEFIVAGPHPLNVICNGKNVGVHTLYGYFRQTWSLLSK